VRIPPEPWSIYYDDVSFSYSGANRYAAHRISLTIEPGEVIAIVGRNGAGKSTLIDLLVRFYDPTSGRIMIGGVDLREWNLDVWREAVGLMSQEVFLFHATIAENIAYAKRAATEAEIGASALEAGLGNLLSRLPHGLQTVVGDRGNRLSGGERQRIALARLLLKNPKVLVFDEPTAHLDGEALGDWVTSMTQLSKGRTTVLITHQPEIARLADRVVLLDNGGIVAEGTHESLLASVSLYASLFASWGREKGQGKRRAGAVAGSSVA
jgi:ABC-type multidrug transport system fused ATPase/permease subunit